MVSEELVVESLPTRVTIQNRADIASIVVKKSLFPEREALAMTEFIHGVVQSNPHVDALHLRLNQLDQADLASILLKEAPSNVNKTIKYYTAPLVGGGVQFASTKPKAKQWADEGWEESQTINAMRHLSSTDTEERLPMYSLASSMVLEW